VYNKHISVLIL